MTAQVSQAGASLVLQLIAANALGLAGFGKFAILYGVIVLLTGLVSGFVGDSLTVLDRKDRTIRSALQGWTLLLSFASAVVGSAAVTLTGFVTPLEGALFGLAIFVFLSEDILRRLLMAQMRFWRIAAVDAVALVAAVLTLIVSAAFAPLALSTLFAALAIGQSAAFIVAIFVQPRDERFVVRLVTGAYGTVAGYGSWRAAQQAVRPGLLTAVRTAVMLAVGLAATGQLEAARLYVAPTMLLVGGLSSFLFASFAKSTDAPLATLLRRADHGVFALLGMTVVLGGVMVAARPILGEAIVGQALDTWMIIGWIAYSATVAIVTPYGALAAVRGRQAAVLGYRVADSVFSLAAAVLLLVLGGPVALIPIVIASGSLIGGFAIRWLILRPHLASEQRAFPGQAHLRESKAPAHA